MRRSSWRQVAAGLLAILATATCLALIIPTSGITPSVTSQVTFSEANPTPPSAKAILSAMEQITDPTAIGTQNAAHLPGLLKAYPEDAVVKYIETLYNFSSNLYDLNVRIQQLDTSLYAGNFTHATENINQLKLLSRIAESNLQSLRSILNTLATQGWDSAKLQDIQQRIDELERLFDESMAQINVLETRVNLRSSSLRIIPQKTATLINESLDLLVGLRTRNGTALPNRNVTISWGPNARTVLTDVNGSATVSINLPIGFPAGNTTITAAFQPSGSDAAIYVSTYTSTQVLVSYYPTRLAADISPYQFEPLDYANANGSLTTLTGAPLANRTITLILDNAVVGRTTTDRVGGFEYSFQIPANAKDGNHTVLMFFTPHEDKFASSNITLAVIVQREGTTIRLNSQSAIALSGMTTSIMGTVTKTVGNQASFLGKITLLLDGVQYATKPIAQDGTFSFLISLPITTRLGNHHLTLVYSPDDPRVDTSTFNMQIYVVNTELIVAVALTSAVGSGVIAFSRRTRRMRMRTEAERIVAGRTGIPTGEEEYLYSGLLDWNRVKTMVDAEATPNGQIAVSYRLARVIINNTLRVRTRESETSREFYTRVTRSKPVLNVLLEPLIGLFETAEYSQFVVKPTQGEQAKQVLFSLHESKWT